MFSTLSKTLRQAPVLRTINRLWQGLAHQLKQFVPRTLFARSLIIVVAPIVLLQVVAIFIYMERYSELVTRRLSSAVAGELAMAIDLLADTSDANQQKFVIDLLNERQSLEINFISSAEIPSSLPPQFFTLLSDTVGTQLRERIEYPLWYDTNRWPSHVEIQIQLGPDIMQVKVRRSRILATNWHIFLGWMIFFSALLLGIALLFLKNQIRPIQRLAIAADEFGKGRDVLDFKPSGASEVRGAAIAFIDMRNRLNQHMIQRTEMLAGVSHDLRTPITRMKLQLAMMGDETSINDLKDDLSEMEYMLDEYLAFAQGESSETSQETNLTDLVLEIQSDAARKNQKVEIHGSRGLSMPLRRLSMKRCITNLVNNACTYGTKANVSLVQKPNNWIEISVEDNGPGIPKERREEAFLPFHRLDEGRNLDQGGSGLGLAIARDIAKSHGGEIYLEDAPSGGLRAVISLPS